MTMTKQPTASRPTTWRTRSAFWWIFLSALAIALLAPLPYLTSSLQSLTHNDSQLAANYVERPVGIQLAFYLHIGFGGLALLLSPLQFAARLRARVPRLHRVSGRIAFGSIAIAGCAGLVLAPGSLAGPVGTAGFGTMALLWLGFAGAAFRAIRRRDVTGHQRWAVRTFALTYAAVTLRLWIGILVAIQTALAGVDEQVAFDRAYLLVPFLAWVPNLVVAELYLASRRSHTGSSSTTAALSSQEVLEHAFDRPTPTSQAATDRAAGSAAPPYPPYPPRPHRQEAGDPANHRVPPHSTGERHAPTTLEYRSCS